MVADLRFDNDQTKDIEKYVAISKIENSFNNYKFHLISLLNTSTFISSLSEKVFSQSPFTFDSYFLFLEIASSRSLFPFPNRDLVGKYFESRESLIEALNTASPMYGTRSIRAMSSLRAEIDNDIPYLNEFFISFFPLIKGDKSEKDYSEVTQPLPKNPITNSGFTQIFLSAMRDTKATVESGTHSEDLIRIQSAFNEFISVFQGESLLRGTYTWYNDLLFSGPFSALSDNHYYPGLLIWVGKGKSLQKENIDGWTLTNNMRRSDLLIARDEFDRYFIGLESDSFILGYALAKFCKNNLPQDKGSIAKKRNPRTE